METGSGMFLKDITFFNGGFLLRPGQFYIKEEYIILLHTNFATYSMTKIYINFCTPVCSQLCLE